MDLVGQPEQCEANTDRRRHVPSVQRVLESLGRIDLPRPIVVAAIRDATHRARQAAGGDGAEDVVAAVRAELARIVRSRLQPIVNGTGILLHTNLGRAPLAAAAVDALQAIAANYSNLEFDLEAGERGHRAGYVEYCLATACGAESATIVNNGAAALHLVLRSLTRTRREVIISRGELIQIGGGFRIPEILEASGALLREVGTTNQTTVQDYARALGSGTGLILKVHRSNFRMEGFVASPSTSDLAGLAHEHGLPLVEDLGSGALFATETIAGLEHEPMPSEALASGADLVTFSGDKLFGGPQAGIIVGRERAIAPLKQDPFFRALRCDKLVLAALQSTVEAHLAGRGPEELPVQRLLHVTTAELRDRAQRMLLHLEPTGRPTGVHIVETRAELGGGSLPRSEIASVALELDANPISAAELQRQLLQQPIPVASRIVRNRVRIDLRTVLPHQDADVLSAVGAVLGRVGR